MSESENFLRSAIALKVISPQQAQQCLQEFHQQTHDNFFIWLQKQQYMSATRIAEIQRYTTLRETNLQPQTNHMAQSFLVNNSNSLQKTKEFNTSQYEIQLGGNFNHYTIQKELGKGGMGVVYQGWDRKLHRVVAIKVLKDNINLTSKQIDTFAAEARAIASSIKAPEAQSCEFPFLGFLPPFLPFALGLGFAEAPPFPLVGSLAISASLILLYAALTFS